MAPSDNPLLLPAPGAAARLEAERTGRQSWVPKFPYQQAFFEQPPKFMQIFGRLKRRAPAPTPITLPRIRGNSCDPIFFDELAPSKTPLIDVLRARARYQPPTYPHDRP